MQRRTLKLIQPDNLFARGQEIPALKDYATAKQKWLTDRTSAQRAREAIYDVERANYSNVRREIVRLRGEWAPDAMPAYVVLHAAHSEDFVTAESLRVAFHGRFHPGEWIQPRRVTSPLRPTDVKTTFGASKSQGAVLSDFEHSSGSSTSGSTTSSSTSSTVPTTSTTTTGRATQARSSNLQAIPEVSTHSDDEDSENADGEEQTPARFHLPEYPQDRPGRTPGTPVVGGPTRYGGCPDRSSAVAMQIVWSQNLTCLFYVCNPELRNLLLSKFRTLVMDYTGYETLDNVHPRNVAPYICKLYFTLRLFLFRRFKSGTPPDVAYYQALTYFRSKGQSPAQFIVVMQDLLIAARDADGGTGINPRLGYFLCWRSLSVKEDAKFTDTEQEETVANLLEFWETKEKDSSLHSLGWDVS